MIFAAQQDSKLKGKLRALGLYILEYETNLMSCNWAAVGHSIDPMQQGWVGTQPEMSRSADSNCA